jgi:hypothetical protein
MTLTSSIFRWKWTHLCGDRRIGNLRVVVLPATPAGSRRPGGGISRNPSANNFREIHIVHLAFRESAIRSSGDRQSHPATMGQHLKGDFFNLQKYRSSVVVPVTFQPSNCVFISFR